jgi:hypothetical protein
VSQQGCCLGYLVVGSADEALRLVILEGRKVVVELGDVGVHKKLSIRSA